MNNATEKSDDALSRSMTTLLVTGVIALNLVVAGIIGLSLYRSKQVYDERASVTTSNLSQVLDENISGIFGKIDIALQSISDEAERQLATGVIDESSLNAFIVRENSRLPELASLRATNTSGDAIYGSSVTPATTMRLAHRDYFAHLRDTPHVGLIISRPLIGGISGRWMIILARRISHPDGRFAGLVYAGITLDYLTQVCSKINVGTNGVITLLDSDFKLVARYPELKSTGRDTAHTISSPQFKEMIRAGMSGGTYISKSSLDSIERTFSFRKLKLSHPLYIFVGLATVDHLADWYAELDTMLFSMMLFLAITAVSSWLLHRQWRRNQKAQQSVLKGEQRFRSFVENANDVVFTLTPAGVFSYVSPRWKDAFGYDPGETIGQPFTPFVHPDDVQGCCAFLQKVMETGEKQSGLEYRVLCKDGSLRRYTANGSVVSDFEHGTKVFLGIGHDISERDYLQQELLKAQKLESISVLAGGIAHNFNNILTGVIGYIAYAKKHLGEPDTVLPVLDSAEASSRRAATLARQLLTFAKGGAPVRKPVPIDDLIRESVSLFLTGTDVKGHIDCTVSRTVNVDSQEIGQAFNNIILNAVQAMPEGGTLTIRIDPATLPDGNRYSLLPGSYVKIVIEDSGGGIPEEDLHKVYDPYFTTRESGTGLGLSSTLSVIGRHKGFIDIASEVGKGTAVTIFLPAT